MDSFDDRNYDESFYLFMALNALFIIIILLLTSSTIKEIFPSTPSVDMLLEMV